MLEHSPCYVQYQISNIKFKCKKKKIKWVGEKWFKSWCHSERSLYKNLICSKVLTVRLFSWFYSQNIHGWRPDGVSAGIGWLALNFPAESHCADWVFRQWRERRTRYFSEIFSQNVGTEKCRPVDVYGPSQGDKLLEEKAQRRIINRWLSLIRNRCL